MAFSLIATFYDLTGWTDSRIAQMLNMPRSTVQAFRSGKLTENLNPEQRDALVKAAQQYRLWVYNTVAEMELRS